MSTRGGGEGRTRSERDVAATVPRDAGLPAAARGLGGDSEDLATDQLPLDDGSGSGQAEGRDAPAELRPGTVVGDRYELLRRVPGGSMGIVYKALDRQRTLATHDPAWVAVKMLTPRLDRHGPALRGLQREAETGLMLDHPNIVDFHGLERDGNRFYIVMEWLPGLSLSDWLDRLDGEPAAANDTARVVEAVGAALMHAHERGIVHADVKPANVMLLPDGTVRLCDFGIARLDRVLGTQTGTFDPATLHAATPAYSSPEVLQGETPTERDDVYSLACLAYRMLAGHRVYGDRDALEAGAQGQGPRPIDGIEKLRWRALQRALSFSRDERQPDVATFLREFGLGGESRRRRRILLIALVVLIVVDTAAALALYLRS